MFCLCQSDDGDEVWKFKKRSNAADLFIKLLSLSLSLSLFQHTHTSGQESSVVTLSFLSHCSPSPLACRLSGFLVQTRRGGGGGHCVGRRVSALKVITVKAPCRLRSGRALA